jgi:hypothetical protein
VPGWSTSGAILDRKVEPKKHIKHDKAIQDIYKNLVKQLPAWCSYKCIPRSLPITSIKHASRNAEVSKLHYTSTVDKDITSLHSARWKQ